MIKLKKLRNARAWTDLQANFDTIAQAAQFNWVGDAAQPVVFQNAWVNYDSGLTVPSGSPTPFTQRCAGYYKDLEGFVNFTGVVKLGVVGSALFTMPKGFRNSAAGGLIFPVVSNGALGIVITQADGRLLPQVGSNVYFALDSVRYYADS